MRARNRKTRESEGKEGEIFAFCGHGRRVVADGRMRRTVGEADGEADGVAEEPEVIFFLFFHPEIISAGEEEEDS